MVDLDCGNPNPPPGPAFWVNRLRANQEVHYAVCSVSYWDCFIHWDFKRKRSLPCVKDHSRCQGHVLGLPRKWLAYLHVLDIGKKKQEIFELTSSNVEQLKFQVEDLKQLRGLRLDCRRGNGNNTETKIIVNGFVLGKDNLPEPIDLRGILLKLWERGGFYMPPEQTQFDCT